MEETTVVRSKPVVDIDIQTSPPYHFGTLYVWTIG
jgi:hypothetical protein